MKFGKILLSSAIALTVAGTASAQEPTRGFMKIEHASTIEQGAANVQLGLGGGGVSLGVAGGELILNRNEVGNTGQSDAVFKKGLDVDLLPGMKSALAVYGGVAINTEATNGKGKKGVYNLLGGAALTLDLDAIEATVAPELVIDTASDATYVNIKGDAFYDMGQTSLGKIKPGVMMAITTEKGAMYPDAVNIYAGARWEFNERLTIDVIPLAIDGSTSIMIPGGLSMTASF